MSIIRGKVYAWHDVDGYVHIRGKKSESFDPEDWEGDEWETEVRIPEKIWEEILIHEKRESKI